MSEPEVVIPPKALFKASEVCEITRVAPYVLRSWEHEFEGLGIAATPGGPRVYRRSDVERVLRIKQLVFGEGLTLAGARRTILGEAPEAPSDDDSVVPLDGETRRRLAGVTRGLRSLLAMLSEGGVGVADAAEVAGGIESGGGNPGAAAPDEFALAANGEAASAEPARAGRKRAWSKAASGAAKRTKKSPGVGA